MTDNTQAPEYLQEQLVKQGNVSSMRYIGDDYTRIIEIREDRLLDVITAYTNKQIEAVLDRLESKGLNEDGGSRYVNTPDGYVAATAWNEAQDRVERVIEAERKKLDV